MTWDKVLELTAQAAIGIAASYFGARFAFTWNKHREEAKALESRIEACNRALFVLCEQVTVLLNFREQVIDPYRKSPYRYFEIKAPGALTTRNLLVDSSALSFLFATKAGREVPGLVAIESSRFEAAVEAINHRSALHTNEWQPLLPELAAKHRINGPSDLDPLVPGFLRMKLQRATDQMIEIVDEAIQSLETAGRTIPPLMRHALKCEEGRILQYERFDPAPARPTKPRGVEA